MENDQKVSVQSYVSSRALRLMEEAELNLTEVFASVQGESSFAGVPTTFIRLAACNLRCSWCDTSYSFGRGTPHSIKQILSKTEELGCRYVCITGGEPLLQENVYLLMMKLCAEGYKVSLETGGSLDISKVPPNVHIILDIKCPNSGMSHKNLWSNLHILRDHDEVKFVLKNQEDYLFAKAICEQYRLFERVNHVLFSPVHGELDPRLLVQWLLKDKLSVRLNLQIHKYIWTPETRGV